MDNSNQLENEENLSYSEEEIESQQEEKYAQLKKIIQLLKLFYERSKIILKKYIWLFILIFLIGVGITLYQILNKEVVYQATITFILQDDDTGANQSNFADPLSSFLLSRSTIQSINIDRVIEIIYSQKLLSVVFFNKCIINGKEDYLINHFLSRYYGISDSYFKSYRGLNGLDRNQFRVFNNVSSIMKRSITIEQTKSGAFVMKLNTINEELSKVSTELLYQNISSFYIDKTTEKAQRNYVFLRNRLDSIRNMLYSSEYQVANFEDRSRNLLLVTARVPQIRQQRNTVFYETLYGEVLKSFETSKVTLNNITPIFQILQRPYYPLSAITRSSIFIVVVSSFVIGLILFLLLVIIYLKVYEWPKYRHLFISDNKTTS
ncbi:MAG TPA: hypothetical protein VLZ75_00830 [Chitinophagales bacterium]|nr:hypothetical protein [Chitinophagales bacterium]